MDFLRGPGQAQDGAPSDHPAVVVLIGTEPLSARQRVALAAMIVVVAELDYATLNPVVGTALEIVDQAFQSA